MSRLRGGVVGLEIPVRDPAQSARFLVDCLGFEERDESALENGVLRLRLTAAADSAVAGVWLEIETDRLAADAEALESRDDVRRLSGAAEVAGRRREQRFETACGLRLVLCRELTEDDRAEPAPLPSSMDWSREADRLVRTVLRRVPLAFRDGARRRATERAEALALGAGTPTVEEEQAVRALFAATPEFQHEALREALEEAQAIEPASD